jgi:hypothetical protein
VTELRFRFRGSLWRNVLVPAAMALAPVIAVFSWRWFRADEVARGYAEFAGLPSPELPPGYWFDTAWIAIPIGLLVLLLRWRRPNSQLVVGPVSVSSSWVAGSTGTVHRGRVTEVRFDREGMIRFEVPDGLSLIVDGRDLEPVPGAETPEEIARMCAAALAVPLVKVKAGGVSEVVAGEHLRSTRLTLTGLKQAARDGSDLSGVDISHLDYKGIDLSGLTLVGATLRHPTKPDRSETGPDAWDRVRLVGADLTGADLQWARLNGASMSGAKLVGARLVGADLRGADLRQVDLSGADLEEALLDGTDLSGAVWDDTTRWPAGFLPTAAPS